MLEIIGAGFGRTGTNSLKLALEQLGFGPCHHMFELWERPEQLPLWQRAASEPNPNWQEVFLGYRSQVDWPGAVFWKELAESFPDAKVVLTIRDEDAWYDSVSSTIIPLARVRRLGGTEHIRSVAALAHELIVEQTFHANVKDRQHALTVYRQHNEDVRETIPQTRLLSYQVSEGWAPLCAFLGVPIPDTPFPHSNRRQSFPGSR